MKRRKIIEIAVVLLVIGVPFSVWIASEVRWHRINDPQGKFSNVTEYLAHGRLPSRVTKAQMDGETYFIAYSPMDTWLAVPSGSAAYVFDESGAMTDWSWDTGDDPKFQKKWPDVQGESSLDELTRLGSQSPSADNN